jgi:hypothetical protein
MNANQICLVRQCLALCVMRERCYVTGRRREWSSLLSQLEELQLPTLSLLHGKHSV